MHGQIHPILRNLHNYAWLRFMVQCNYYILCVHYPHTLSCLFLSQILIPQAIDIDINVFVSLHYSPMEKKACHNNSQSEVDFVVLKCLLDRMSAFACACKMLLFVPFIFYTLCIDMQILLVCVSY